MEIKKSVKMSKTAADKSRFSTIKRVAKAEKATKKKSKLSSRKYIKTITVRITKIP